MNSTKIERITTTIKSTRDSLARVICNLESDPHASLFDIRDVQIRLNAASLSIKELQEESDQMPFTEMADISIFRNAVEITEISKSIS